MIRRAASREDFETCAEIFNEVAADDRVTGRELAETVGEFLLHGDAGYAFAKPSSVAGATYAMVRVRPPSRRRGVGSALLEAVRQQSLPTIWGRIREDDAGSLAFAHAHGFREVSRDVTVLLDVKPGDGERRADVVELQEEHLPGAYAVVAEAMPETAVPQVAAAPPYSEWLEKERHAHRAVTFVALDRGEVVGYAALTLLEGMPQRLENYLTAVKKSHRRRGIATALKQAEIAWAAEHGYTEIVSDMVDGNTAMRAVNARLGFRPLPAWVVVEGQT
jgi:GNAT superfamily N-acetyltransferase